MGVLFSILGFIALAAWAGLVFAPAAALLVAAAAFFIIGVAVSDVTMPSLRRKPKAEKEKAD